MICLERSLDEALDHLRVRLHELRPDNDFAEDADDELDSIASSTMNALCAPHHRVRTVRFSDSKEVKTLQKKLSQVEQENRALRNEVSRLKSLLGRSDNEEKTAENDKAGGSANIVSEGGILKFIRGSVSLPS
jgi:prefoldin subunit 5